MRKLLLIAMLTVSIATSAFASGTNVNVSVLNNFKTEFRNAANVQWTSVEDYAKATFTVNNVKMEAFYNISGDLIGTSKAIDINELPTSAKRSFAKKYSGYTVKEVIHYEGSDDSTGYFFSAENDKESIIFKVAGNQELSTYKKTKK